MVCGGNVSNREYSFTATNSPRIHVIFSHEVFLPVKGLLANGSVIDIPVSAAATSVFLEADVVA